MWLRQDDFYSVEEEKKNLEDKTNLWTLNAYRGQTIAAKRAELFNDSINKETWEQFHVCYTINSNVLFSISLSSQFLSFLSVYSSRNNNTFFYFYNTIQSQLMKLYAEGKQHVFSILHSALSLIYIIYDA